MIKFFADTASIAEIDDCFTKDVDDGITTNPMIMKNAGVRDFSEACRSLISRYPRVPISLETDLQGIPISDLDTRVTDVKNVLLRQARTIADYGANAVVKIPICRGGLEAVTELDNQGIKTNVTACMNAYQALTAAQAGATYVSLFANRMLDTHIFTLSGNPLNDIGAKGVEWKKIVADNKFRKWDCAWNAVMAQISYVADELRKNHPRTELIVGSIRSPSDIERLTYASPHIITIPYGIVGQLRDIPALKMTQALPAGSFGGVVYGDSLTHPTTSLTLEEFERAADSYRNIGPSK